jgi:hypothetical protein
VLAYAASQAITMLIKQKNGAQQSPSVDFSQTYRSRFGS